MRKWVVGLGVALFAVSAFGSGAQALTKLTKQQVSTVCDGKSYCEKKCGANGEHTCGFGCGPKSCSGQCLTCPGSTSQTATRAADSVVKTAISSSRAIGLESNSLKPKATSITAGPPKAGLVSDTSSASMKTGSAKNKSLTDKTTTPLSPTAGSR